MQPQNDVVKIIFDLKPYKDVFKNFMFAYVFIFWVRLFNKKFYWLVEFEFNLLTNYFCYHHMMLC